LGGLLSRLPDLRVEPPLGVLHQAGRRPVERTLQVGALPLLDVDERGLDAGERVRLLALDVLAELLFLVAEADRELGERAAALVGMEVEVRLALLEELAAALLELCAQATQRGLLLLGRRP
jgi:hypothetical protein